MGPTPLLTSELKPSVAEAAAAAASTPVGSMIPNPLFTTKPTPAAAGVVDKAATSQQTVQDHTSAVQQQQSPNAVTGGSNSMNEQHWPLRNAGTGGGDGAGEQQHLTDVAPGYSNTMPHRGQQQQQGWQVQQQQQVQPVQPAAIAVATGSQSMMLATSPRATAPAANGHSHSQPDGQPATHGTAASGLDGIAPSVALSVEKGSPGGQPMGHQVMGATGAVDGGIRPVGGSDEAAGSSARHPRHADDADEVVVDEFGDQAAGFDQQHRTEKEEQQQGEEEGREVEGEEVGDKAPIDQLQTPGSPGEEKGREGSNSNSKVQQWLDGAVGQGNRSPLTTPRHSPSTVDRDGSSATRSSSSSGSAPQAGPGSDVAGNGRAPGHGEWGARGRTGTGAPPTGVSGSPRPPVMGRLVDRLSGVLPRVQSPGGHGGGSVQHGVGLQGDSGRDSGSEQGGDDDGDGSSAGEGGRPSLAALLSNRSFKQQGGCN